MQPKGMAALGDVILDFDRMELCRSGHSVPATSLEFKLLKFFVDHPNRTFSRKELIHAVWTKRKRATSRAVDTCVVLAIVYAREKDLVRARQVLAQLQSDFRQNPLFAREMARLGSVDRQGAER